MDRVEAPLMLNRDCWGSLFLARSSARPLVHSAVVGASLLALPALAAPLKSGPQPGERPLPFTSNMVTGTHRGQQFCYVCELKDEPAVLVFARRQDATTARLMQQLQQAARQHRGEKLFGWFCFLGEGGAASEQALETAAEAFARTNGASNLVVSALGDPQGPPGYVIAPDAAVTALFFRSGKVIANRAFRAAEWNARAADAVMGELPKLLGAGEKGGTVP